MKYLVSLINNSRQPARRTGVPASARQAAPFSPLHPEQEGSALRPDEQPLQPAPHFASHNVPDMASDRRENRPALIAEDSRQVAPQAGGESAIVPAAAAQMDASERPLTDDLTPRPVAFDESDTTPANADLLQPGRVDASTSREETPLLAAEPAVQVGRVGGTPAVFAAQDTLSAVPNMMQPAAAKIPAQATGAELPPTSIDSFTAGAEEKSAAHLSQLETGPGDRTQANQQPGSESARESSAPKLRSQEPAAIPVRPMQAAVQQEQAALGNSTLLQSVKQNQPPEIPQVRIGQINVLVEDQAPAKPKQNKRSVRPAAPNPFGLRGL